MTDKDMLAAAPKPGHYKDALIEELDRCDESPAGEVPLPDDVAVMVERLRTGGESYEELLDLCTRQAADMLERMARENESIKSDLGRQAAPEPQKFTLTCPKCGVDRTQEHCKNPSSCPMIGHAQSEPALLPDECPAPSCDECHERGDCSAEELSRNASAAPLPDDVAAMVERLRDNTLVIQHPERNTIADMLERLAREARHADEKYALNKELTTLKECLFQAQEAAKAECEANEKLELALQNCRLFAARNRKEDWALLILRFCAEGGVAGSVTR